MHAPPFIEEVQPESKILDQTVELNDTEENRLDWIGLDWIREKLIEERKERRRGEEARVAMPAI